ncbi:hypothetical protein HOD75_04385 [archaeon]|mgnify:CR=1 FL=1|jgi:rubrerythrin|nr:hypothetical protein [archaeon]MBT4242102.1 hypothetical protein [archaeon]MBT4417790.1 hypothetical protein [archaeon]
MGVWICRNCNFRFKSGSPLDCPYCGKEEVEKEKSAIELVNEVAQLLGN